MEDYERFVGHAGMSEHKTPSVEADSPLKVCPVADWVHCFIVGDLQTQRCQTVTHREMNGNLKKIT